MMQASDELDSYLHTLLPNRVNLVESLDHQFSCMLGLLSIDHSAPGILRPGECFSVVYLSQAPYNLQTRAYMLFHYFDYAILETVIA